EMNVGQYAPFAEGNDLLRSHQLSDRFCGLVTQRLNLQLLERCELQWTLCLRHGIESRRDLGEIRSHVSLLATSIGSENKPVTQFHDRNRRSFWFVTQLIEKSLNSVLN